jgi:hypothetical protein
MTPEMIDASMKPFKQMGIVKILGGEPSNANHIVERIYDNIDNNGIKVNELWVFTNGLDRESVGKLVEIIAYKPKTVGDLYIYVSRGKFHDQAIRDRNREPKEADDNIEYLRNKYGRVMSVETQWDEEMPLNVGHARDGTSNPVEESLDTRLLILFGQNKLHKLVFSPHGYERPFFCNPEDVQKLSFGHIINDGMEKILSRGLRFTDMNDKFI